jgi:glycine cleavage system aminomethyltransferase T
MSDTQMLHPLFPNVRRSPYFLATLEAGASAFMAYNHMYMPISYGRAPRAEYENLTSGVALWDVGAERQTAVTGPDAVRFADFLATRDLSNLEVGQCRFTLICDEDGTIITEPIVLRPFDDTVWISHGDVDLTLWARGIAMFGDYDVSIEEPSVSPMQLQGPLSADMMVELSPGLPELAFYRCAISEIDGVRCVISRTGWSGELGFEIYPLCDREAPRVWSEVLRVGRSRSLQVAGPNLSRALERTITDTHYYVNSGMTPYESGQARLVDLDHGPFVGQEALRAAAQRSPERITVGLICDEGIDLPTMDAFWPVEDGSGNPVGIVRWAAFSFVLERSAAIALLDARVSLGDTVAMQLSDGPVGAIVTALPLTGS